jgi:hypothetical protein
MAQDSVDWAAYAAAGIDQLDDFRKKQAPPEQQAPAEQPKSPWAAFVESQKPVDRYGNKRSFGEYFSNPNHEQWYMPRTPPTT